MLSEDFKKYIKGLKAADRDKFAKMIIQCCLIGEAALTTPGGAQLKKSKLIKGVKNIMPTEAGFYILDNSKEGKNFFKSCK